MNADPKFDIALFYGVLRRRKWLILIPVVLLTGVIGLGSFLLPNIYAPIAQVVVRQEQGPVKELAVQTQITQQLGGVLQALRQPTMQKQVFERLEEERPRGLTFEEALLEWRDSLVISQNTDGQDLIVLFRFEGTPESYAVAVVNAFAREFEREGSRLVANSLLVSLDFVNDQIGVYSDRLASLDEREQELQQRLSQSLGEISAVTEPEQLGARLAEQMAANETRIEQLALNVEANQEKAAFLRRQLAQTQPTLEVRAAGGGDATTAALEQLLAQARSERAALGLRYTPQHPQMIALAEQIDQLENRLDQVQSERGAARSDVANPAYENLRTEVMATESQVRFLSAQRDRLQQRNRELRQAAAALPSVEDDLRRILDERANLRETYQTLLTQKQGLELKQSFEQGSNTGRFEVTPAGLVPLEPVRPSRRRMLMLGFGLGLVLGISLAFLAEYLDHSVRSRDDLQRYTDMPILAVLPRTPR